MRLSVGICLEKRGRYQNRRARKRMQGQIAVLLLVVSPILLTARRDATCFEVFSYGANYPVTDAEAQIILFSRLMRKKITIRQ